MILRRAATRGELWRAGGRGAVSQSARAIATGERHDGMTPPWRVSTPDRLGDRKSGTNQRC
jgi:hypothetical protein